MLDNTNQELTYEELLQKVADLEKIKRLKDELATAIADTLGGTTHINITIESIIHPEKKGARFS